MTGASRRSSSRSEFWNCAMKESQLDEIAVLYRAHYHAVELQLELSRRGIPYQITSGVRFFEQAHIKDVAAFIRFVANPRDEVAFKRMVKLLPGIGGQERGQLWRAWETALDANGEIASWSRATACDAREREIEEIVDAARLHPG